MIDIKIGDKVLVPNWPCFEKKTEAICARVSTEYSEKFIEKMYGIHPNVWDDDEDIYEREYIVKDTFILDDITIILILSNRRLLWVWKFEKIN